MPEDRVIDAFGNAAMAEDSSQQDGAGVPTDSPAAAPALQEQDDGAMPAPAGDDPLAAVFAAGTAEDASVRQVDTVRHTAAAPDTVSEGSLLADRDAVRDVIGADDPLAAVFTSVPAGDSAAWHEDTIRHAAAAPDTLPAPAVALLSDDDAAEDADLDAAALGSVPDSASAGADVFDDIFVHDTAVYVKLTVEKDIQQRFSEGAVTDTAAVPADAVPAGSRGMPSAEGVMRKVLMLLMGALAATFLLIAARLLLPDRKAPAKGRMPAIRIHGRRAVMPADDAAEDENTDK